MPRKLIVAAFLSLDGVMQAPGGPEEDASGGFPYGGWLVPHFDDALGQFVDTAFDGGVDLLLGRRTYDIFAAHWPRMPEDDPFAARLNGMTKYVATRSPGPLDWRNSHAIGPDAVEALRELKSQAGNDLLTQGSVDLLQSLLAAGLVDVLKLMTFPVVLGRGKRLFRDGVEARTLALVDSRVTTTGVVITTHEAAGPVETGSFALE